MPPAPRQAVWGATGRRHDAVGAGSLSRCEREGGSWHGRWRAQPPDTEREPGANSPSAGLWEARGRSPEPGRGCSWGRQPSQPGLRFLYNHLGFQKRRAPTAGLTYVRTDAAARSPPCTQPVRPSICPSLHPVLLPLCPPLWARGGGHADLGRGLSGRRAGGPQAPAGVPTAPPQGGPASATVLAEQVGLATGWRRRPTTLGRA